MLTSSNMRQLMTTTSGNTKRSERDKHKEHERWRQRKKNTQHIQYTENTIETTSSTIYFQLFMIKIDFQLNCRSWWIYCAYASTIAQVEQERKRRKTKKQERNHSLVSNLDFTFNCANITSLQWSRKQKIKS